MSKKTENPFDKVDGYYKGQPFARLTEAVFKSKVYSKLNPKTCKVYTACLMCRKYTIGRDNNGKSKAIQGNPLYFYFSRAMQQEYNLNNPNTVRAGLIELVQAGFIDVIECNANTRKKNIYAFSSKWIDKEKGKEVKLTPTARAFIQGKKTIQ